jgi:hypothetical protein
MNDDGFLDDVNRLAEGYYNWAELYNRGHYNGFADLRGIYIMPDKGQYKEEKKFLAQIEDDNLAKGVEKLLDDFNEIRKLDKEIIEWLAHYVGLSSAQEKKDIARLNRKLRNIITNGPFGGNQGQIWAVLPEYQAFIVQSDNIMDDIAKDKMNINQRIQQLLRKNISRDM